MAKKKKPLPPRLQAWVDARNRHKLTHAQVQMARELGLNPKKFGGMDNHRQEPWKTPLPQFIEHLYVKRFGRDQPDVVVSIEDRARQAAKNKPNTRPPSSTGRPRRGSPVGEYQYYEFLAVDRPLKADQLDALRALSTRAEITSTTFVNTYHWGDFRGDPRALMEGYFDAFLYTANWGTRRLMVRLPARRSTSRRRSATAARIPRLHGPTAST